MMPLLALVIFMYRHYYFAMCYFDSSLVVPAAFLLHEQKFESIHENFAID